MNIRHIKVLAVAIALCSLILTFAFAEINTVKGKMQNIDMKNESFKFVTTDGKNIELKAPSVLMEDLKPGDDILVTIDEDEVIAISRDKEDAD